MIESLTVCQHSAMHQHGNCVHASVLHVPFLLKIPSKCKYNRRVRIFYFLHDCYKIVLLVTHVEIYWKKRGMTPTPSCLYKIDQENSAIHDFVQAKIRNGMMLIVVNVFIPFYMIVRRVLHPLRCADRYTNVLTIHIMSIPGPRE